jgi:hypothetical protein
MVVRGDEYVGEESNVRERAVEMQQTWEPTRALGTATARVSLVIAQPQLLKPAVSRKAKEKRHGP